MMGDICEIRDGDSLVFRDLPDPRVDRRREVVDSDCWSQEEKVIYVNAFQSDELDEAVEQRLESVDIDGRTYSLTWVDE